MQRKHIALIAIALIGSMGAGFIPPTEERDEFHFVVLGDSQFDGPAEFNRIVDQARRLRPAFVIQVGDLIDGYLDDVDAVAAEWQRFDAQIAPLAPVPFIAVAGNHDVLDANRQVDPALEDLFAQRWGALYFAFEYKNALFIVLNSDSSEGLNTITGKQLEWLEETLETRKAEHTFAFMHRPAFLTRDGDRLHELFVEHGVDRVFYGHHHHYHHFKRDGIGYTMTNANGAGIADHIETGSMPHLLQVSVRGAEVDVAVIHADAIYAEDMVAPQDNYDYFALHQNLVPKSVDLKTVAGTLQMPIPVANESQREIQVLAECSSADRRWLFEPTVIAPIQLGPGESETLTLTLSSAPNRMPDTSSQPECTVRVPLQTAQGRWIEFERTVTGVQQR